MKALLIALFASTLAFPASRNIPSDTILFKEQGSTPSNPSSGYRKAYIKSDGKLYGLDSSGTESELGGGGGGDSVSYEINQVGHGFSVGNFVRINGSGTFTKAQADSAANAEVDCMVSVVTDTDNFTCVSRGYVDTLSGLTANTRYFLDTSTAGAMTATEPSTIGQVSKPVFASLTTTAGFVDIQRGQLITVASSSAVNEVWVYGQNGHGGSSSGDTYIKNFTTVGKNVGTAITYTAQTTTTADKFTINEDGWYAITYQDAFSAGGYMGITVDSSNTSTQIYNLSSSEIIQGAVISGANITGTCSVTLWLAQGKIVRAQTNGQGSNGFGMEAGSNFRISKVR